MLRQGEKTISRCLRYNADDEHGEHIILGTSMSAQQTFLAAFAELGLWLQKTTSSEIETAITDIAWAYRNGLDIDPDEYEDTPVYKNSCLLACIHFCAALYQLNGQQFNKHISMKRLPNNAERNG